MVRILLIDGHAAMLPTFQASLFELGERVMLITVGSLRMARRMLRDEPRFDFVLLDLQPTVESSFEALAEICSLEPRAPVLVCSTSLATADIVRAIYLGAAAFVPRAAGTSGLLAALRSIGEGRIYLPPLPLDRVGAPSVSAIPPGGMERDLQAGSFPFPPTAAFASLGLTRRQGEVLALLLEGEPNKVIARRLNLSVETIKDHVTRLLRTLNVQSRTQAVLAVREMGKGGVQPQPRAVMAI